MNVYSDNIKFYIEGVYVPILSIRISITRNIPKSAIIKMPLGIDIVPELWANAFVQITKVENNKEVLFYEGMISNIDIVEDNGYIIAYAESKWTSLNFNTTLDYVAPKRYGITDLSKTMKIYIGTESELEFDNNEPDNYQLSRRYFFLNDEKNLKLGSEDSLKLRFIIDRTPFAELFAFNLFEDIVYQNFLLSKSYIERFNLLTKIDKNSKRSNIKKRLQEAFDTSEALINLDESRSGIQYKKAEYKQTAIDTDLGVGSIPANLPYIAIASGAKASLLNSTYCKNGIFKTKYGDVSVDTILSLYDQYCKQVNIDPNLLIAQAEHESAGFNPNAGQSNHSQSGAQGWAQFIASTWLAYGSQVLDERYSIPISIKAQVKYMRLMFQLGGNDSNRALSNYVDGPGATNRPQTPAYIKRITSIYNSYFTKP